jgi:hypothetical protein
MKAIQKSGRVLLALACVLLIAAFPVLFLYLQNADSVTLTQVLQPLLIFMGLSAALFLLVWPIVRSAGHAALITSVFVAVLENFGRVAESNFCGTPFLQTNQEKNGNIASKAAT